MKAHAFAAAAAVLMVMLAASMTESAYAGFPVGARPAASQHDGGRTAEARYRCHCRSRRYHLYSGLPEAPETAPVYPAPRTGFTLRKLFDAGYL